MADVRMFGSTIFWSCMNKMIFGCFIMLKGSSNIFNGTAYSISRIRPLGWVSELTFFEIQPIGEKFEIMNEQLCKNMIFLIIN